jgi:GIY-YIG catalytic domain
MAGKYKKSRTEQNFDDLILIDVQGIYKIINEATGKYYVGSSKNIPRRWKKHLAMLNGKYHANKHLQSSWIKYGKEQFKFLVVEKVPETLSLTDVEQKYLDIAKNEQSKTYNIQFECIGWNWETNKEKLLASLPRGSNHKDYCRNIYTFKNLSTNELFTGTRCDFYTKHGLKNLKHHVRSLVLGKRKSVKGWYLKTV